MSLIYITHDTFLKHETFNHPENKNRLIAINHLVTNTQLKDFVIQTPPRKATKEEILEIHTLEYFKRVEEETSQGASFLDGPDTVICKDSLEAAYLAAGSGLVAADMIMSGEYKTAICAIRPPGHHAEKDMAMGFCIFNNVAITAKYLQKKHGLEKILILDWDVHHGNGTEHSFYEDDSVYYISIHQYPHYPGTGADDDTGLNKGKGYNLNIPMPSESTDEDYIQAFNDKIIPTIKDFAPDFILISNGMDAHINDPLASMNLSSKAFGEFTKLVVGASESAQGRIISLLEGGYDLPALSESMTYHILALN